MRENLILVGIVIFFSIVFYHYSKSMNAKLTEQIKKAEEEKARLVNDSLKQINMIIEQHDYEKQTQKTKHECEINRYSNANKNYSELVIDKFLFDVAQLNPGFYYRTNLVFGENILRQLDHIIISKKGILVIENKNWFGEIHIGSTDANKIFSRFFDSVKNSDISELENCYFTHVHSDLTKQKNDKSNYISFRSNSSQPFHQVRVSSVELNKFIRKNMNIDNKKILVRNVLYFSNSGKIIIEKDIEETLKKDKFTTLIQGQEDLKSYLDTFISGNDILDFEEIKKLTKLFKLEFISKSE